MHRYVEIAEELREQIQSGQIPPGNRLPSIRKATEQFSAGVNTIRRAYELLEDWRLIVAHPKSGFEVSGLMGNRQPLPRSPRAVSRPRQVKTSIPVRLNACVGAGPAPTLGPAVQSPSLMPMAQMNKLMAHVARYAPERCHSYASPPGAIELRQAIAARASEIGISTTDEEIVITSGAKEAVYLSIKAATQPGDTVVVESPAYYALLEVIASLGLRAIEVATDAQTGLNLEQLDHVLRTHDITAVALCSNYSNPLGCTMSDDGKAALCELVDRSRVMLIEDDVYGDLCFCPPRPKAFKSFDQDERVMYCGSFSKTISPGLRLGWAIPGRLRERVELLKLVVNQTSSMMPQLAVAEFLGSGGYDRHLRSIRGKLSKQLAQARHSILTHFPDSIRVSSPLGGHVLWIELAKSVSSLSIYEAALESGIQLAPGPIFSTSGGFKNYLRVNTGFPWTDELEGQVERIAAIMKRLAKRKVK